MGKQKLDQFERKFRINYVVNRYEAALDIFLQSKAEHERVTRKARLLAGIVEQCDRIGLEGYLYEHTVKSIKGSEQRIEVAKAYLKEAAQEYLDAAQAMLICGFVLNAEAIKEAEEAIK